jgi:hypothetical protein
VQAINDCRFLPKPAIHSRTKFIVLRQSSSSYGSGHAKYLELLQDCSENTLIYALYRAFQGQKGHYSNLGAWTQGGTVPQGIEGQVFIFDSAGFLVKSDDSAVGRKQGESKSVKNEELTPMTP